MPMFMPMLTLYKILVLVLVFHFFATRARARVKEGGRKTERKKKQVKEREYGDRQVGLTLHGRLKLIVQVEEKEKEETQKERKELPENEFWGILDGRRTYRRWLRGVRWVWDMTNEEKCGMLEQRT